MDFYIILIVTTDFKSIFQFINYTILKIDYFLHKMLQDSVSFFFAEPSRISL